MTFALCNRQRCAQTYVKLGCMNSGIGAIFFYSMLAQGDFCQQWASCKLLTRGKVSHNLVQAYPAVYTIMKTQSLVGDGRYNHFIKY